MTELELIRLYMFISKILPILLVVSLAVYVYLSLATMRLAKKIGTKNGWLAWIPIANFYLYSKMAGMHWWPVFLLLGLFVPYIGLVSLFIFIVFNVIWFWKIFKKVGRPGWWALLSFIPIVGWPIALILIGVAAWSGGNETERKYYIQPKSRQVSAHQQKIISPRSERIKKIKKSLT